MKSYQVRPEFEQNGEFPTAFGVGYKNLVDQILNSGITVYNERTQSNTYVLPQGARLEIPPGEFPLLSLRRLPVPFIVAEAVWFLSGQRKIPEVLEEALIPWDPWKEIDGDIHSPYGFRMRHWESAHNTIDQIEYVINLLKRDPSSRHAVVVLWEPGRDDLPVGYKNRPCPLNFQFSTHDDRLNMHITFRSNDVYFGLPNDLAGFSLMQHLIARHLNYDPGMLVYTMNDPHIYENTVPAVLQTVAQAEQPNPIILDLAEDFLPGVMGNDPSVILEAYTTITSILRDQYSPAISIRNVDIAV